MHLPSPLRATLSFETAHDPAVRVHVGRAPASAELVVASDAWRAFLGKYTEHADWNAACPVGPALAAVTASVEVFKRIVRTNSGSGRARLAPDDFAYSAFNHGTGDRAVAGPDVRELRVADTAIAGCGAGGSGVAFILAMHPRITGSITLIEPGKHKASNLNRYLASTATDTQVARHKLASLVDHLAHCSPTLALGLHAVPWEQLDSHPWDTIVSAVDTVEARWQIQRRCADTATIIDLAVDDLLYSVLRVTPGGRCLFCKHPFDPDMGIKQRALRWGVPLDAIREWTATDTPVDEAMLQTLAETQGRDRTEFQELLGVPFRETPALLECGATSLRADVPSQAPVLPLATGAAAAIGAAELIKNTADMTPLDNWLAHDLRRSPTDAWTKHRNPLRDCPHHGTGRS